MLTGRCLCGGVRYEIDGKVGPLAYCHCTECRRSSGSAFGANVSVRTKYLRVTSGSELVTDYESSPGKFRCFCRVCGSPMWSRLTDDPDIRRIRLGTLDGDPDRRPLAHCFVGEKAVWYAIDDDLPQFEKVPPAP